MKALLTLVLGSVLVGLGLGAALAYLEVGPQAATSIASSKVASELPAGSQQESSQTKAQQFSKLPQVVAAETVFNFDRIERGTSMRHDFVVENTGDAPLWVLFESNTCKCTGVEMAGKRVERGEQLAVQPGKQADITLEWAAKTAAGPFRHGAQFSTNDPRYSRIELEVNGQVVESTSMRPAELLFGTIRAGDTKEAHLYLLSFIRDDVKVLDWKFTTPELTEQVKVDISPADKSELPDPEAISGLKISATFRSGEEIGPFRGWLSMTTNLPGAEKLLVPIIGSVKGDVSIYGPGWNASKGLLRMGHILGAEGKQVRLNLKVSGTFAQSTKFEVDSVLPSELKVTLGEARKMGDDLLHVPVLVEVPPHTRPLVRMGEPASSDASIVFKSNHPQAKQVHMRVHFSVSQ